MKIAEIAREIDNADVPNVYIAMRALEKRGLVELVPNSQPQRWRLVARFRQPPAA
jgi:sugar-specific transcriptional regulator TrmB